VTLGLVKVYLSSLKFSLDRSTFITLLNNVLKTLPFIQPISLETGVYTYTSLVVH